MNRDKDIRKQFQSKFKDYRAPVPDDGWKRIEESLNAAVANRSKVIRRRWLYASSAAAVLLLLLVSLLFINNPVDEIEPVLTDRIETPIIPESKFTEEVLEYSEEVVFAKQPRKLFAGSTVKKTDGVAAIKPSNPSEIIDDLLVAYKTERVVPAGSDSDKYIKSIETDLYKLVEETYTIDGDNDALYAENSLMFGGSEEEYTLSVNGKGGLTSFYQSVNAPMTLRSTEYTEGKSGLEESDKLVLNAENTGSQAEMEHSQPVSFGITISKSLSKDLSLETGLVYSYLYSKTKNTSVSSLQNETQRLHYLGIPLNLNYNIVSFRNLNIYASVGGMIEKDIYGEFHRIKEGQTLDNILMKEIEIEKISQNNPQISVNAGLGLSYPIFQDLKLYGKIGGAYYFDANNKHKTIYSDRKIVMDLSLGLRYEFK